MKTMNFCGSNSAALSSAVVCWKVTVDRTIIGETALITATLSMPAMAKDADLDCCGGLGCVKRVQFTVWVCQDSWANWKGTWTPDL
ncbi:hypothetical protein O9992_23030 [Vibrio lentus]|nr:hypothetical protein [Vibrio lentus]